MKILKRWTPLEIEKVADHYKGYENGSYTLKTLRDAYQGRSIAAIREKARTLSLLTDKPMESTRLNPVYAAVEKRMIALGYGPEVIKSIISPRKASIPTALVNRIESFLGSTPNGKAWFFFTTDEKGVVQANPLREGQDLHDVMVGQVGAVGVRRI